VIKCLIQADIDPVSGRLRRGALLRFNNPPEGVSYKVLPGNRRYPRQLGHYEASPLTASLAVVRYLSIRRQRFDAAGVELVHSFFWQRPIEKLPLVHENDQSPSQFLSGYFGIRGVALERLKRMLLTPLKGQRLRSIVVWTKWAKYGFLEDGFSEDMIHVIPPPMPLNRPKEENEGRTILFLGRDFERKGGRIALQILSELSRDFDLQMLYVGPIKDSGLRRMLLETRRLKHYPNPSDETLYGEIYPAADIFFLPTSAEAFGLSILEAMSYGIPVVSSNLPPIAEICGESSGCFLSAPNHIDGYRSNLLRLIESKELREASGRMARRRIEAEYSPEKVGRSLVSVYESAL
jgi:glycosyltransferase involved in cell wall biosynthesis